MAIQRVIRKLFIKLGILKKKKIRKPFSKQVYAPSWRLKNYYAVKEFGEEHKRWFIEQRYMHELGEFPDLDNPKLFNEKIHWLNLNYRNPLVTRCCDKYEQKKYVSEKIGEEYTVKTIKVYKRANDIDVTELPSKFAIKVNWGDGQGYSVVVDDKNSANLDKIKSMMANAIQPWNNLYYSHFFWGYKDVKPVIFVEEYLEHGDEDIIDYKVHCFNGKAKFILVCEDRNKSEMKKTFVDNDWNILPFYRKSSKINSAVEKPQNFEVMMHLAEVLAEPFPFARIDFYNLDGDIRVGEITFNPALGLEAFYPKEWNRKLGDMLELPAINTNEQFT